MEIIDNINVLFGDNLKQKQLYTLTGKTVFFVNTGVDETQVKAIAAHKLLHMIFRDARFVDDAMKTNVGQLFKTLSPNTEMKTILGPAS